MEFGNFDIFAAKDEVANQERVLLLEPQHVYADPHNVRRAIRQEESSCSPSSSHRRTRRGAT